MELDELMNFLKSKFNNNFTYDTCFEKEDFSIRYKLFSNNVFIGVIPNPREMYQDICFMYRAFPNDNFSDDDIHNTAINEIELLFLEIVTNMLNKI